MVRTNNQEKFMNEALRLAIKGRGYTSPNPAVGCVIVKDNKIVADGYHHAAGKPHAEAMALNIAGKLSRGAELYVTLEPCCTYGRTPPCTKAIIDAKIKLVVIGTNDPSPRVNYDGVRALTDAGIEVISGILEDKCRAINPGYNKYIKSGLPYVLLKYAQSLDGRIATTAGSSKWISSSESLKYAHRLRAWYDVIMIGSNTANTDNPQLTVRNVKGKNPVRVILSASGKLNKKLHLRQDESAPVIIFTSAKGKARLQTLEFAKAEIITVRQQGNILDLKAVLRKLAEKELTSVLVEGGSGIITGFLKRKLADSVITIMAPIIIGKGISAIGDLKTKKIDKSIHLKNIRQQKIGPDCVIFGDLD